MVVRLVTPDADLLGAAVDGPDALSRALRCRVADGWDVFPRALQASRDALAGDPDGARWGTRLIMAGEPPTLVGWGGFKGAPRDGAVELGYAVAPDWEGRGVATAAVGEMLRQAFAAPEVEAVLAHTRAEPGPSARVLEKAGFAKEGEVPDGEVGTAWRFRRARRPAR